MSDKETKKVLKEFYPDWNALEKLNSKKSELLSSTVEYVEEEDNYEVWTKERKTLRFTISGFVKGF